MKWLLGRCATWGWILELASDVLWTRAGTWGIASSQEPASEGRASCLMATADPRSCACATKWLASQVVVYRSLGQCLDGICS